MKNLVRILVVANLCFYSVLADDWKPQQNKQIPVECDDAAPDLLRLLALADGSIPEPPSQHSIPQYPVPPVLYASQKTKGILMASIGGGLMVGGIALAANSGHDVRFQEGYLSRQDKGKLYGGLALGIAGAALLWYGLSKIK